MYIALLSIGTASAQQIIKETNVHSSRVYDSLEKLTAAGLASHVMKGFVKHYQAASPEALYRYCEEKKEIVSKVMPELKMIEGMKKEEIDASIYKGKEGLKTIHSLMLKEGKDILVLGGKGLIFSELQYFMPNFERERIKKGMTWKIIWDSEKNANTVKKRSLVEGKVLPKGYSSAGVVNIFGKKVAIVHWEKDYPTAVLIENPATADAFRKWFYLIYNLLQ